ncbi:TCR/Tet family MFS transporter [Caulobacter sp. S45]|uniref:TCR/Tet family MFS transporter n=1 Tax=Caulobacter sp. S45 TaxID=1641861 RepID=UPI00131E0A5C|nr:TCR/Tet family MFS transporter [Caulobacter sp. S45]
MSDPARTPPKGRAALTFIFITVLLDIMALGMVTPVLPSLVTELLAGSHLSAKLLHHADLLSRLPGQTVSMAAVIYGLFNTVFALMQFFFSPVIGSLSDRFGRRPLILASNIGLGLNYALMAWAPTLQWLFVGRVISGITGASFGTASAYIADTTEPDKRAAAFGVIAAAFGAGFVLGPALGGMLGEYGARVPFVLAACLSLANAAYGFWVLPESLPRHLRSGFSWKRANPIGALILLRRHPELTGLASVAFLSNLAQVGIPSTLVLYALHRYGWRTGRVGLTLAVTGIALILVQVFALGRIVQAIGNRWTLVVGLMFGACGMLIAGIAPNQWVFWAGIPVIALWGISGVANQTIMTRHVEAAEQGQLQGANSSLTGISELIGPSIFTLTFAYFVTPGHSITEAGAPFLLAAAILAGSAVWAWHVTRGEREPEDEAE